MSDSDENIPYGRKFGSGFRGTRYDGTVADDVENTPIIPDDMYRRIALINLDIHLDRVKIERFHFCLPFMHIASACENQSSERSKRIIGVPARRTDGISLNRPEIQRSYRKEITDELRRKIASRLRGKAKIATPDTVDSLLMEAVYGDDVMGVYAKRYLTDIADLIDPSGFDSAASTEMGD